MMVIINVNFEIISKNLASIIVSNIVFNILRQQICKDIYKSLSPSKGSDYSACSKKDQTASFKNGEGKASHPLF